MLGKLGSTTILTPGVNSRSLLKVNFVVLEMKVDPDKADLYEIFDDILKGDINLNPTEIQNSIPCTSFGLTNCTK